MMALHTIPIELPIQAVADAIYRHGVKPRSATPEKQVIGIAFDLGGEAMQAQAEDQLKVVPTWARLLRGNLKRLESLEGGWDGPGSARISRFALYTADRITRRALVGLKDPTPPRLVPGGDGSVQIEWHEKRGELELDIDPAGGFSLWGRDRVSGIEFEGDGESALALFNRWAARLAAKPDNGADVPSSRALPFYEFAA